MMGTSRNPVLFGQRNIVGRPAKQRHQSADEAKARGGHMEPKSFGDTTPSRNSRSWSPEITIILFGLHRMIDTRAQRIRFLKKNRNDRRRSANPNPDPSPSHQSTVHSPFVPFMTSSHHQSSDGERRPQ
jgi:hypothetical protein